MHTFVIYSLFLLSFPLPPSVVGVQGREEEEEMAYHELVVNTQVFLAREVERRLASCDSEYHDRLAPLHKGHTLRSLLYYNIWYILTSEERTASLYMACTNVFIIHRFHSISTETLCTLSIKDTYLVRHTSTLLC